MHLCVMKIWKELQLCAINIHSEKKFLATMNRSEIKRNENLGFKFRGKRNHIYIVFEMYY